MRRRCLSRCLQVLLIGALPLGVQGIMGDEPPFSVHITDDPQTNVMGWSHAFTVRDPDTGARPPQ